MADLGSRSCHVPHTTQITRCSKSYQFVFYYSVVFYYEMHCIELEHHFFRLVFFLKVWLAHRQKKTPHFFQSWQLFAIIFSRHHIFDVNSGLLTKDLSISFRERHPMEYGKEFISLGKCLMIDWMNDWLQIHIIKQRPVTLSEKKKVE